MNKIILVADNGMAILFDSQDLRPMGNLAKGVRGLKMMQDVKIIASFAIDESLYKKGELFMISDFGILKYIKFKDIETKLRGGSGVRVVNPTVGSGKIAAACITVSKKEKENMFVIVTEKGVVKKTFVEDINTSKGECVIKLDKEDKVASISII